MRLQAKGFTLIEVLVSLVIFAVGITGATLFSAKMIGETGQNKARLEAIALAQSEIEDYRQRAGSESLASITSTVSRSEVGVNANFMVSPLFISSGDAQIAEVSVSWLDQSVTVSSLIVSDLFDADEDANGGGGIGGGSNPYKINLPVGGAEYGVDAPDGSLSTDIVLGDELSTVKIVSDDSGSGVKLVFGSGEDQKELLTYKAGEAFAEIRGVVYVDYSKSGLSKSDFNSIVVRPSDTGVCPKGPTYDALEPSDWFFEYTCFFGAGWYGNITVQYLSASSIDATKEICVGDHTVSESSSRLSRHPQLIEALDVKREYRGYGVAFSDNGVFVDDSGAIKLVTQGVGEGDVYGYGFIASEALQSLMQGDGNHDFVLVGNNLSADADCLTVVSSAKPSSSGYQSLFEGMSSSSGAFESFVGNNGDFICLQVNGVSSCPAEVPTGDSELVSTTGITLDFNVVVSGGVFSVSEALFSTTSQFPSGYINKCAVADDGETNCGVTPERICKHNGGSTFKCEVFVPEGSSINDFSINHTSLVSDAEGSYYEVCTPFGGIDYLGDISNSGFASDVLIAATNSCQSTERYTITVNNTRTGNTNINLNDSVEFIVTNQGSFVCDTDLIIPSNGNQTSGTWNCDIPVIASGSAVSLAVDSFQYPATLGTSGSVITINIGN